MTLGIPARLEQAGAAAEETASIENLSTHGARVITDKAWRTDDELVLSSPRYGLRSTAARVVYCLPMTSKQFVVGLEFAEPRAIA